MDVNLWTSPDHVLDYLGRADSIPHRAEGEATLLECIPATAQRVLDLGTGDGRLLALVKRDHPDAAAVAIDFSPAMLEAAQKRFRGDSSVEVISHNLETPLPELGKFDAVVSSFAIHHLVHERKRAQYAEVFQVLPPGGVFCNRSTSPLQPSNFTWSFCAASAVPRRRRIRRTNSWTWKSNWDGCAKLALLRLTVIGNGANWPS